MTEVEKIKSIITRFRSILEGTDMDICESVKGRWYFSRYNEECEYYDCFREFETAEELVEIILGELAFDMHYYIEKEGEPPIRKYSHENIADMLDSKNDYTEIIEDLWELIQSIQ